MSVKLGVPLVYRARRWAGAGDPVVGTGTLKALSSTSDLMVEVGAELHQGDLGEFEIAAPTGGAISGVAIVKRVGRSHGTITRYILTITEMQDGDRERLDRWIQDLEPEPSTSFSSPFSSSTSGGAASPPPVLHQPPPAGRAALREVLEQLPVPEDEIGTPADPEDDGIPQSNASISLRSAHGLHFARLTRIGSGYLHIEADAVLELGTEVEFQVDLTGYFQTVYGRAEIRQATLQRSALQRYVLSIVHMMPHDRKVLGEWLAEMAQGARPERVPSQPPAATAAPSTDGSSASGPPPAPPTPSSGSVPTRPLTADLRSRPDYAETIRTGPSAPSRAIPPVRSPDAEALLSARSPRSAPSSPAPPAGIPRPTAARPPESRHPTRPGRAGSQRASVESVYPGDPVAQIEFDVTPPRVVVQYGTSTAYRRDWQAYLRNDALFLQISGRSLERDARVDVEIVLPAGARVVSEARVVLHMPGGFGISLDLSPEARKVLADASGLT